MVVRGEVEDSVVVIWFHQVLGNTKGVWEYWFGTRIEVRIGLCKKGLGKDVLDVVNS